MTILYVTSVEGALGKTTLCAGVGKHLLDNGKRVGFFQPLIGDEATDSDGVFMKHILALEEPISSICLVINDQNNPANSIKEACTKISQDKDVVIIEGIGDQSQADYKIVEALDARVIIVADYSKELVTAKLINSGKDFGKYLLGVVLNKVPRSQLKRIHNEFSTQFGGAGINLLGVLPEDRVLLAPTIGALAEHLHGEILNCTEKSAELVENFMVGAMVVDSGPQYFSRKVNKAVVVKGERPDMQLAALETSTRCLILSGNTAPIPAVLYRAEDENIPIILAKEDTIAIVMSIEDALSKIKFNQEEKLPKLAEIMEQHFNFQAVYQGLGLAD